MKKNQWRHAPPQITWHNTSVPGLPAGQPHQWYRRNTWTTPYLQHGLRAQKQLAEDIHRYLAGLSASSPSSQWFLCCWESLQACLQHVLPSHHCTGVTGASHSVPQECHCGPWVLKSGGVSQSEDKKATQWMLEDKDTLSMAVHKEQEQISQRS